MRLRVIDVETTGGTPSEVIEVGTVDVVLTGGTWSPEPPQSRLFRPAGAISFHAMAIHHLTPSDFPDDLGIGDDVTLKGYLDTMPPAYAMVAHNADFERGHLSTSVVGDLPWICTVKAARCVWPEAPGYSNQVLRYWRSLELDPQLAMPPHRAGPDAWVTAHILLDLLAAQSIDVLINPPAPEALPFGKYRGEPWKDVPTSYLNWMRQQPEMDSSLTARAAVELARRKDAAMTDGSAVLGR